MAAACGTRWTSTIRGLRRSSTSTTTAATCRWSSRGRTTPRRPFPRASHYCVKLSPARHEWARVRQLDTEKLFDRIAHQAGTRLRASPNLEGDDCLVDEHSQAVERSAAAVGGGADEPGLGRVKDHVGDNEVRPKRAGGDGHASFRIAQADRRGIDEDRRICGNFVVAVQCRELGMDFHAIAQYPNQ